jgi:L-aspartate oxidase
VSRPPAEVSAADTVVVGSGVAGLSVALRLAALHRFGRIAVISKSGFGDGSSRWAQGGIACALDPADSPEQHAADTLAVAGGLGEPAVVRALAGEAPERIARLIARGARFDRAPDGTLELGLEGGHGRRRILHANGDATGAEIMRALTEAAGRYPAIEIFEHTRATDLVLHDGRIVGLRARSTAGVPIAFHCPAVIFAAGGFGHAYLKTTNPPEATGDALAMAARAGADLVDMEFVQFHPTALDVPGARPAEPMPLMTEALRGAGALLLDGAGRRFMPEVSPRAELAPRDVVAREIWKRLASGNRVFLDCRPALRRRKFPTAVASCRERGLDPTVEPVPVSPAAHYTMGGVAVDEWGRSSLPGLWACGEAAGSGLHGANRLASNSLLEGLVFGARVADDVSRRLASSRPRPVPQMDAPGAGPEASDGEVVDRVRALLWERAGVVRTGHGLQRALRDLERLASQAGPGGEGADLVTVGRLVVAAALERRESRGAHFRRDYPSAEPHWRRRLIGRLDAAGCPQVAAARPAIATRRAWR